MAYRVHLERDRLDRCPLLRRQWCFAVLCRGCLRYEVMLHSVEIDRVENTRADQLLELRNSAGRQARKQLHIEGSSGGHHAYSHFVVRHCRRGKASETEQQDEQSSG